MVIPIIIHGNKTLREIALEANIEDKATHDAFILDLIDTLKTTETGVGIAAPQVGNSVRIFISWADRNRISSSKPIIFINPEIVEAKGSKKMDDEGCLSVPKVYARVERFQKVRVKYLDENWEPQEKLFKGFEARVIQHENDHLNGLEFFDHLSDVELKKIQYKLDELSKGNIPELEYEYILEG